MSRRPAPPEKGWRRKPQARADGYEMDGAGFQDRPTPRWVLEGPHAEEDLQRVMRGEICLCCWQPFPEPLNSASCARIMAEMAPFGRPDHDARRLICASHCPMCGTEVSPEMAQAFFRGVQESTPGTRNRGEHGDYEGLISNEQPLYLPPGWDR